MIEINLLPGDGKKKRSKKTTTSSMKFDFHPSQWFAGITEKITDKYLLGAIGAAGLSGLLIALMVISQTARGAMLEARETKAVKDSAQFSAVLNAKAKAEATRDSLYQQIAIIKSIDDSRYLWSHLMYEISNALPQYTWLTEVTQTSQPRSVAIADTVKYAASGDTANKTPRQKSVGQGPRQEGERRFAPRGGKGRQVQARRPHRRHSGAHALHEVAGGVAVHTERSALEVRPRAGRRQGSHRVHARGGDTSSASLRDQDRSTNRFGGAITWHSSPT